MLFSHIDETENAKDLPDTDLFHFDDELSVAKVISQVGVVHRPGNAVSPRVGLSICSEVDRGKGWKSAVVSAETVDQIPGCVQWYKGKAVNGHVYGAPKQLRRAVCTWAPCGCLQLVDSAAHHQGFNPRAEQRYNGGTTCRGATSAVLHSGGRSSGRLAEQLFRMFRSAKIPDRSAQN